MMMPNMYTIQSLPTFPCISPVEAATMDKASGIMMPTPTTSSSDNKNYWASRSKHAKKQLEASFTPSDYSVICGRSKLCFDSVGNRRFRVTCKMYLDEYDEATAKMEKSRIVTKVYNLIRESNPGGGAFVTHENGRWYECSERISREKIGAMFRDLLFTKYKSSAKSKQARKNSLQSEGNDTATVIRKNASAGAKDSQLTYIPLQDEKQEPKWQPDRSDQGQANNASFMSFFDVDDSNTMHCLAGGATFADEDSRPVGGPTTGNEYTSMQVKGCWEAV